MLFIATSSNFCLQCSMQSSRLGKSDRKPPKKQKIKYKNEKFRNACFNYSSVEIRWRLMRMCMLTFFRVKAQEINQIMHVFASVD